MLPNLFIIGAPRCGTTSLHYYLGRHPEIAMSREKEPGLFARPDWRAELDSYRRLFPAGTRLRGEASTAYSRHPVVAGVPERIHELVPEAKLIYLVGDPVRRIESSYAWRRARTREERSFEEILDSYDDPANMFVAASRYATQVERYLGVFPRSQLLILDQDDLRDHRRETIGAVFRFLGVDDAFTSPEFDRELNTRADLGVMGGAGWWLWYHAVPRVAGVVPERARVLLRGPLRRALAGRPAPAEIDREAHAELLALLADEARRLRELTGKEFAGWSV